MKIGDTDLPIKIASDYDPSADVIYFPGNCLKLLDKIPDNSISLIVTSPPYNLGKPYEHKIDQEDYLKQQGEVIEKCITKLSSDGSICWQVGNYVENGYIVPLDVLLYPLFVKHEGIKLRNRIMWHFGHGLHASKRFSGRYEVILWFTKTNNYIFNLDSVRMPQKYPDKKYFRGKRKGEISGNPKGKNPSDVWEIPNVKWNHPEKTIHPCQFPVELVERLILALTNENDWILDPFMGVGSTAIAAIKCNRKAIGAEIVEEYVKIGLDRVKKASEGTLKVRPMWKPIYEPKSKVKKTAKCTLDEVISV